MYKHKCYRKGTVLSFHLQFCLIHQGANVNAAKLHETALHHAAKTKNIDLIELLVEFGGNVYARDNLNKKPINYTSLGSPSYLCLEFYESKFTYLKYASCHCEYTHNLRPQIKHHLCCFLFFRYPPQSTADQQSGSERDSRQKSVWSCFQAGFAQSHYKFSFLHTTSSNWSLII